MIYPDIQIVLIYILIRIYGNIAGIAVRCISFHVADGIAVMHQTIALVVMICFIISAVYLYSFFAGQFNERLGGVFGFGLCRWVVCGRLLSIVYYGEYNGKILACQQSPFIILPLESNTSALWIGIERMVAMCFVVLVNIFRGVYRDRAGVISGSRVLSYIAYCKAAADKAVCIVGMGVVGSAMYLYRLIAYYSRNIGRLIGNTDRILAYNLYMEGNKFLIPGCLCRYRNPSAAISTLSTYTRIIVVIKISDRNIGFAGFGCLAIKLKTGVSIIYIIALPAGHPDATFAYYFRICYFYIFIGIYTVKIRNYFFQNPSAITNICIPGQPLPCYLFIFLLSYASARKITKKIRICRFSFINGHTVFLVNNIRRKRGCRYHAQHHDKRQHDCK